MKKVVYYLAVFAAVVFTFAACRKDKSHVLSTPANDNRPVAMIGSSGGPGRPPYPAPAGTHWVLEYRFQSFHFHRPKKNCEQGFWFCTIDGHWQWVLVRDGFKTEAYIDGDTAFLWGQPITDSSVELHFPITLKTLPGYTDEDLDSLNVDDTMFVGNNAILQLGNYPVTQSQKELIVQVPLVSAK